ncbi:MAG: kynureninase [bacterium]|nr:kynureninase [Gammaproteobacteria bacterium]HIL94808.1 kynureninase [Pseudomonadales bacterium]
MITEIDDPLEHWRDRFVLPEAIYLDGNSLGPLLIDVKQRLESTISTEWGQDLISSWNKHQWIDLPGIVGEKIAPLVGSKPGQVICTDNVSLNIFKLLATALLLQPDRVKVVAMKDTFPTDLYMIQGMQGILGRHKCELVMALSEEHLLSAIDNSTNIVLLSHVNFRTGELLDIAKITQCAHEQEAMVLLDLSHSVGVVPIGLDALDVDFAAGCGYKFLNGGPGAPAFLYVNKRHQNKVKQPLSGWMGHQAPFDFHPAYTPAVGIAQYLSGTPGILGLSALDAAISIWEAIDLTAVRNKSKQLTNLFIDRVTQEPDLGSVRVASPLDAERRGSQVSLVHEHAYAIVQAMIERGVVCDYREPDLIRFGFAPLYIRYQDVVDAAAILADVMKTGLYHSDRFQAMQQVT